ncbi:hypothetical protein AC579_8694 [Pseudocercospora musae]|uniref:Glycosyl hydrolase family 32 C-terminal domain-containing protein n=1 Tax=Pseudocercospora musae TaxID=113226 RepID=A0A139I0T0_9PEZI|nr:hypothetical protein AC579_8694 [Pseudocercospora musae]
MERRQAIMASYLSLQDSSMKSRRRKTAVMATPLTGSVSFGAEGYADELHPLEHWSLFVLGHIHRRENGSAEFETKASGVLDRANSLYSEAVLRFEEYRRVVWGWSEEDLNNTVGVLQQGFEISEPTARALRPQEAQLGSIHDRPEVWEPEASNKSYTVTTVAQRPLHDVVTGIQGEGQLLVPESLNLTSRHDLQSINSSRDHLQTTITQLPSKTISASNPGPPHPEKNSLSSVTHPHKSSLVLDRTHSTLLTSFNPAIGTKTFVGHFEPLQYPNSTEPMIMDIFVDGGLLETIVNGHFAMASRIYPSRADALSAVLISEGDAVVEKVKYWELETNVWQKRPLNASSGLKYDEYYETHITFENPYWPFGYEVYAEY